MNTPTFHNVKTAAVPAMREVLGHTEDLDTDDPQQMHEHLLMVHIETLNLYAISVTLHLRKLQRLEAMP